MVPRGGTQWVDATRKNYYAKYSTRVMLFLHFVINISTLPLIFQQDNDGSDFTLVSRSLIIERARLAYRPTGSDRVWLSLRCS